MKHIKKYNEATTYSGTKNEELDLEYVKNCLVDLLDNAETKVFIKYQIKIFNLSSDTNLWTSRDWVDENLDFVEPNLTSNFKFTGEKEIIGIKIETKVDGLIPSDLLEIPDWCDEVKRMSNSIIGGEKNIKEEYPNYYIDTYNEENGFSDEPSNCLIFKIEVLTK